MNYQMEKKYQQSKENFVKVIDPILDIDDNKIFACLVGGSQTTNRVYSFQTFSNSSAQIAFTSPSPGTFISKKWLFKVPVRIEFTGDSNDPLRNLLQSGEDSFRSYPIASSMSVLDIKINGESSNLNLADIIKPLLLYHNGKRNLGERELSMTPTARDQSQTYSELVGSIRNPLASFYDSNQRDSMGRGAFPLTLFTNTTTSAVVEATLEEELFLSPLSFGNSYETDGFISVQDIEINITWESNLANKMWSHSSSSTSTINTIQVTIQQPVLELKYVTPPMNMPIPRFISYSYNEIKRYVTTAGSVLPGNQALVISNNLQVGAIPRFVYIYVRKRNQDQTFTDTDSYASIENIKVDWDNQNALLSSSSPQQLYNMARKNGLDCNWTQFSGLPNYSYLGNETNQLNGIGSVLSVEFGTDIGLKPYQCPGLRNTFNLQIQVTFTNRHPTDTINFDLYLVTIIPGIFNVYDRSANKRVGIINPRNVMEAKRIPGINYQFLENRLMSGGSKFTKAMKLFAREGVKIGKILGKAYNPELSEMIDKIPVPYNKKGKSKKTQGRSLVGGEMMSKTELLERLANY